jgi:hypothetical protein
VVAGAADESVTSRSTIGKKSMLLESLSNIPTIARGYIKIGVRYADVMRETKVPPMLPNRDINFAKGGVDRSGCHAGKWEKERSR